MNQNEADIEKVVDEARGRLKRCKRLFGEAPGKFWNLIAVPEIVSHSYWCNVKRTATVSLGEVEPYILSLMLEGIVFGSLFPGITRGMNREFYDSVNIDWDTWNPIPSRPRAYEPLALPKVIYQLPGEPSILGLEGQEQTLLQLAGWYVASFYPELIDPLDLGNYKDAMALGFGLAHLKGWWLVYEDLQQL